ncbi:uncharacterized protein AB675_3277 [Cyphellophora attinorum]|uniref:Uncharacterized protein n=1 Tax=Cyphellophora attinorum TaxID=1664694 RepID=A0A0N0NM48_9EURO|nr:uncharacterized protein AB675_3277 [Phialophora attinorum]KPI39789.1 hypothetical protein AB675_3277 [Phialophora attinorum]
MHKRSRSAGLVLAAGAHATATGTAWSPYPIQTTTTTIYPTCPAPVTLSETSYVLVTGTTTVFETVVYTDTVTTTQPTTEVSVLVQPTTETFVQPTTEVSLVTVVQITTETQTVSTTLTETTSTTLTETVPTTITETTPTTQLVTLTATEELELYTSTTRLTSLRICPTRITNPTFTVAVPMPTQWTWGCPPGWICKPLQENCDFEAGTPDRNFYCSPNECVPAPGLPQPLPNWGDTIYSNSTPLNTPGLGVNALDSYFNVNPTDFGFGYEIFVVDKVVTITSTFVVPPAPTALPAPPAAPANNNTGLRLRQAQTNIPGACYTWCNNPMLEVQAIGKTDELCQPNSAFLTSLSQCMACIDYHEQDNLPETDTFLRIAPQFQQFLDYCAGFTTTTISGTPTAFSTSAAPTEVAPTVTVSVSGTTPASSSPTLVPTTVTTDVTGTAISGIAPTPATTYTWSEVEAMTVIIVKNGTTTSFAGNEVADATLVMGAVGASQTTITTSGPTTYTTGVPASSLGDQTSATEASESDSATPSASAASGSSPAIASGNGVSRPTGRPELLGVILPLALVLI